MINEDLKCLEVAGECFGVLSRSEARKHLSRSQLDRRVSRAGGTPFVRLFCGVYRVEGAPQTWRQRVEALSQWAGENGVLSHRTAAALHGFDGFRVEDTAVAVDGPLEVTVKPQRRKPQGARIYRCKMPPKRDIIERDDGLRVTSVPRTLLDLGAQLSHTQLRSLMSQALRQKKTTLAELHELLRRTRKRPGIVKYRVVLQEIAGDGGPTDSELEELAVSTIVRAGVRRPDVQRKVVLQGKRRRIDLYYEAERVIVETDGYAFHSGIECFEDDRKRRNGLVLAGYTVLQWTWRGLKDTPAALIRELRTALAR